MSIIDVTKLKYKHTDQELYSECDFRVFRNEHLALVGANGTGKTTLLRLLNHDLSPDVGSILVEPNVVIGYLDQYALLDANMTVKDYLYAAYYELFEQERLMEAMYLEVLGLKEHEQEKILIRASNIGDILVEKGFYAIKSKVNNILNGLGLGEHVINYKIKQLSGGMRAKLILGKLLLEESDILLLDEPTNFLDVAHIEWLINFLNQYEKGFIVISHHEEFLSRIARTVLAIENMHVNRYKGDYNYYLAERIVRFEQMEKSYTSQQRKISDAKDFIQKNITRASTTKRAQSRRKMLEKLTIVEKPSTSQALKFKFLTGKRTGIDIITTNELEIGYNEKPLLSPITETIRRGDKVVITGKNGVGKTTFLKTILNIIPNISGEYHWIDTAVITYFSQDQEFESKKTPFELVSHKYNQFDKKQIYHLLSDHGIDFELSNRSIETLSGGEKTKVRLALMRYDKANVLILDEPTNHLDVMAKEELRRALKEYIGTIILVSHEREFYSDICDYEIEFN